MGFGNSTKPLYVCSHIVGQASAQPIYKEARRVQAQRTASNQPDNLGKTVLNPAPRQGARENYKPVM